MVRRKRKKSGSVLASTSGSVSDVPHGADIADLTANTGSGKEIDPSVRIERLQFGKAAHEIFAEPAVDPFRPARYETEIERKPIHCRTSHPRNDRVVKT